MAKTNDGMSRGLLRQEFVEHFADSGGDPVWFEFIFRLAETLCAKNSDYCRGEALVVKDPYRNFRDAAKMAHVSVVQGIVVRKADKLARQESLRGSSPKVIDENLLITLLDEAAYAIIEMGWQFRQKEGAYGRFNKLSPGKVCELARQALEKRERLQEVPGDECPQADNGSPILRLERSLPEGELREDLSGRPITPQL